MTKSIVTGGAGFIGSHLAEGLVDLGHDVVVIDSLVSGDGRLGVLEAKGIRLERLDIRDERTTGLIESIAPDNIFHLAAQASVPVSVANPIMDAEVNIIGSLRLLEGAAKAGSRFVFSTSGGCIYGSQTEFPIPETAWGVTDSPYGASKKSLTDYLNYYSESKGVPFVNLAFANVYGPRQDAHGESGVVAIFASRLLRGESCIIFGDGKQTRDYVYVADVVDACVAAITAGDSELINVGTGVETPLLDLYDTMLSAMGMSGAPPVFEPPRPGDLLRSALDVTKAKQVLGWAPKFDFSEGVKRTIDWFRANLS